MHKLLTDNPGEQMLMPGNEAISRGAAEAGVAFGADKSSGAKQEQP
jgi:indolepyruvate ferredoxin oxidoreductase alpha subunit